MLPWVGRGGFKQKRWGGAMGIGGGFGWARSGGARELLCLLLPERTECRGGGKGRRGQARLCLGDYRRERMVAGVDGSRPRRTR